MIEDLEFEPYATEDSDAIDRMVAAQAPLVKSRSWAGGMPVKKVGEIVVDEDAAAPVDEDDELFG